MLVKRLAVFIIFIIITSCDSSVDYNNQLEPNDTSLKDQLTYEGSYAVFDLTLIEKKENISSVKWEQNPGNPEKIQIITTSDKKVKVCFKKRGDYKFVYKIKTIDGNLYQDTINVQVKPRQSSLIEDIFLEARIRYKLRYPEGKLNAEMLNPIDTLPHRPFIMYDYKTKKLNGLEHCENIEYLPLSNESIKNLQPISNLTKLKYLNLNQNYTIKDISPLSNLVNLEKLIIYSNPIEDLTGIGNLTNLKELWIMYTPIQDISPLKQLVNLEKLYIGGVGTNVNFTTLGALQNLENLIHLDLAGRGIQATYIQSLKNLTELELLYLSYNEIDILTALKNQKKLVRFYIRNNKLKDLQGIENLTNLEYLDAANNKIININGINKLSNLNYLDASNNKISNIDELKILSELRLIGLSNNNIEDISPLVENTNLGEGVEIDLINNPLSQKSIDTYIPQLIERGVKVFW